MKKISRITFTITEKQELSHYTKTFIDTVFKDKNNIRDKQYLLDKLVTYSKDTSCSELILKQSILKGSFPRVVWNKEMMIKFYKPSSKIEVTHPKENTDVRFLTEISIGDHFASSSSLIKKVVFNSENPKIAKATTSYGNMYKDITINYNIDEQLSLNSFDADIKSGNNAYDVFKGLVGVLPVTKDYKPYGVINNNDFMLDQLQQDRINYLKEKNIFYTEDTTKINKIVDHIDNMTQISVMSLDPISINNLIQEQLLHCIALNALKKQPSLFTSHKISYKDFHLKYFQELEPYINTSIFDNKENFNGFMTKAIRIYNDHIENIYKNINNDFWKGTGFDLIAHDVFK